MHTHANLFSGTSSAAYGEAERLFNLAASKCPDTIIVGGGYSQGAAVMTASVRRLDSAVQDQIAGVILYGNTQNAQTNGEFPIVANPSSLPSLLTALKDTFLTFRKRSRRLFARRAMEYAGEP